MHGKFLVLAPVPKPFARMRPWARTSEGCEADAPTIIGAPSGQHAGPGETFDGVGMQTKLGRNLRDGVPSGPTQMVVEAIDAVHGANMAHPRARKRLGSARAWRSCVEYPRDLGVGLLGTERTYLFHDGGRRATKIRCAFG